MWGMEIQRAIFKVIALTEWIGSNRGTMPGRAMPGSASTPPDQGNQARALPDADSLSKLAATQRCREWGGDEGILR